MPSTASIKRARTSTRPPELRLNLRPEEIVIDNFAGGGGASTGLDEVLAQVGRHVDIAINHDAEAIALHKANHPNTEHYIDDIFSVDIVKAVRGRPVGFAWYSPDCFPAGTMILTRHGYRAIENIGVGAEVLTHTGRWRRVTQSMRTRKPLLRLSGRAHPGLLVSCEHPFYARRRADVWSTDRPRGYRRRLTPADWVPASALGPTWYWAAPTSFPVADVPEVPVYRQRTTSITPKLMWLAGLYVADGWTRLTNTRGDLVITCGKHEATLVREQLSSWPRAGMRAGADEMAWHERDTGTATQFTASHRGLVEWLRAHFGHGAADKQIPVWALGMKRALREALLDGYAQGDGHVHSSVGHPLFACTTVSKALAFSLKALAGSLGYSPSVYRNDKPNDVIEGRKVNARPAWDVRWRLQIAHGHEQTFREGNMEWSEIRKQENACADEEVYNLSVEEDESYIADGIVVHNCTYYSKARGGKPFRDRNKARRRRGLAWVIIKHAKELRAVGLAPRIIAVENVQEMVDWGPLDGEGRPDKLKRGLTFRRWCRQLQNLGYELDMWKLKSCDYGAPTTRERLFIVARRDGVPIMEPQPTHGPGRLPYRTAAECIDWSLPCQSIFGRKKPLAANTMRRIAEGIRRYVLNSSKPFIVPVNHSDPTGGRVHGIDEPLRTITASRRGDFAVVQPFLMKNMTNNVPRSMDRPVSTVLTGNLLCGAPHKRFNAADSFMQS